MPDSSNNRPRRSSLPGRRASRPALFSAFFLAAGIGLCPAQTPPPDDPKPKTYLQIVNVTSVPKIAVSVNGNPTYPEFTQGLWTGFFPVDGPPARYAAANLADGRKAESEPLTLEPQTHQTLVIMGDFSTDAPPEGLPQPNAPPDSAASAYPPNVVFKIYSDEMKPEEKLLRFRFVNAMPRTPLTIEGEGTVPTPILPGADLVLDGQPKPAKYKAVAGEKSFSLMLLQKKEKNQTVIFYLKDGVPTYMAVTEDRNGKAAPQPETK